MTGQLYVVIEASDDPCMFLCSVDKLSFTMGNIQASLEESGHTVLNATRTVHDGNDAFAFTIAVKDGGVPLVDHWYIRPMRINDDNPFFIFTPLIANE